jgi:hypothetical protein
VLSAPLHSGRPVERVPTPIDAAAAVPLVLWDGSVVAAIQRLGLIGACPTSIAVPSTVLSRPPIDTTPPLDKEGAFLFHSATLMWDDQHVNT